MSHTSLLVKSCKKFTVQLKGPYLSIRTTRQQETTYGSEACNGATMDSSDSFLRFAGFLVVSKRAILAPRYKLSVFQFDKA
jgi:hypothetical protein